MCAIRTSILVIAALIALIFGAGAQIGPGTGVTQTGAVTANHCAVWSGNDVIKDGGFACSGGGGGPFLPLAGGALTGAVTSTSTLTLGGATLGSNTLAVGGQTQIIGASFGLTGNISATAWTTSGIRYINAPATLTDTTSSGTVATAYTDVWGGNTIAASSAAVFTNYFGSYFKVPAQGTNVTLTSAWALGADSLKVNGVVLASTSLASPTFYVGSGVTSNLLLQNVGNALGFVSNTNATFNFSQSSNAFNISIPGTSNSLQLGAADAASPVAQTLRVQSVVGGTASTNGVNWTLIGSLSTGAAGVSGDIIFQTGVKGGATVQATPTTALTIKGETQNVVFAVSGFTADNSGFFGNTNTNRGVMSSGVISGTAPAFIPLRSDTTTGIGAQASGNISIIVGGAEVMRFTGSALTATLAAATGTGVVCNTPGTATAVTTQPAATGCVASARHYKMDFKPITPEEGFAIVMGSKPESYRYKPKYKMGNDRHFGLVADDMEKLNHELVTYKNGEVDATKYNELWAFTWAAMQKMQTEIAELKRGLH